MTYEEFTEGIGEYRTLFDKGLKKQANKQLFEFTDSFKKNVSEEQRDEILERFCRELIDGDGFPEFKCYHLSLPFQLSGLVFDCLIRACEQNKMPQMRWEYELFGKYYNPHDPKNECKPYEILERAYNHSECDQRTVDLYFNAQLNDLDFGAHHFPDYCCIARDYYDECVSVCEKILSEKAVRPELENEFRYYKTLYELWYKWSDGGRNGDFGEICRAAGLDFTAVEAFYYSK